MPINIELQMYVSAIKIQVTLKMIPLRIAEA